MWGGDQHISPLWAADQRLYSRGKSSHVRLIVIVICAPARWNQVLASRLANRSGPIGRIRPWQSLGFAILADCYWPGPAFEVARARPLPLDRDTIR